MGCAVLGIGIWLQVSKGSYASIIPNVSFLGASVLCIVAGVMILIIGFFGCCGAIMESQCMLITVCACYTIGCNHMHHQLGNGLGEGTPSSEKNEFFHLKWHDFG